MKRLFIILLIISFVIVLIRTVRADSCSSSDWDCQISQIGNDLTKLKSDLSSQTANYSKLLQQLTEIKGRIEQLTIDIQKSEGALAYQKSLLNERVKSYYKNINKSSVSLLNILVADNFSKSIENFFYQKSVVDDDKNTIIKIVLYIKNLENQKIKLAQLKTEVDQESQALSVQISQTKQKIAELSAKQQQLLAQKLASLNISRSAASMGRCDSDLTNGRDPGFSPKFGFFTYGVPNRVGLNQWGAKGRADAGQNYETILRAYYNFDEIKNVDTGIQIRVDGHSTYSLEEYVKRIYEVPGDWPSEALKAQAIAARSYALAYTNNGSGSICDSESCQVFQDNIKTGAWEQAVNDTAGKVMVQGGQPIKAWFSSTHGGYVLSSGEVPGWSGTSWTKHATDFSGSVGSFSDLQNNAYDKNSPWFYCDWGSRSEFNKTAWLRPNEVGDIINIILLAKLDSSTQEHLYQPDNPPAGVDVWDAERVKSELRSRGGNPYNNVSDISMSVDFGSGRVTSVNISGDGGSSNFDGGEFKNWFNLRAPANIQIVGPLYNVEKR